MDRKAPLALALAVIVALMAPIAALGEGSSSTGNETAVALPAEEATEAPTGEDPGVKESDECLDHAACAAKAAAKAERKAAKEAARAERKATKAAAKAAREAAIAERKTAKEAARAERKAAKAAAQAERKALKAAAKTTAVTEELATADETVTAPTVTTVATESVDTTTAPDPGRTVAGGSGKPTGITNALARILANIERAEARIASGEQSAVPAGLLGVVAKFMRWLGIEPTPAAPAAPVADESTVSAPAHDTGEGIAPVSP